MKKYFSLLFITFVFSTVLLSQTSETRGKGSTPVLKEVSGLEVVKSVYPDAAAVEKSNGVWFNIVDANKKVLGYCLSSKPYSDGIIGYNNTTPVIVVTDKNKIVKKVAILSNWETAAYLKKLEKQNYFNSWNGLKINEALKKKATVDSYSGATITAGALSKNIEIILKKAAQN
ncbi:MAG: FMN-binding protein [Bacteroidales bacterium]